MSGRRKGRKKIRRENSRDENVIRYFIFCEGEMTEVNYFEGIKRKFGEKGLLRRDPNVLKTYNITIKGKGLGTEKLVKKIEKIINRSGNIYGNIWLVFDKDDFSDDSFNKAIEEAINNGYNVAWSNKCFELWLFLYFESNYSDLTCNEYVNKLDSKIKQHIDKKGYSKNREDIFEILEKTIGWRKAYNNAEKLIKKFRKENSYAKKAPCTTVHYLVKELMEIVENKE
ncbi:RloB family protein [Marinitoga sp. 1135]|uniref:RloB family protein n=1 Tax=Marinitoga sp. 1135 TaxID=1643333 RepID=UPI001585DE54|nr:RloB family protein [Marinitoga sp. 1135]